MSYNGSGTFNINSAGQPVVTGTVITSTAFNALTSDLATGLTTALTKDGQTTPTANIPMGGFKITGLGVGTAAADAVRFSQLQNTSATTFITAAGTDTITGTVTPTLTAYATGQQFSFVVAATNTAAVTLNVDGVGAKAVTRTGSVALVAGDMVTGQVVIVEYDGTRFQLINGNSFTNLKASGTLGVTGATTLSSTLGVTGLTTLGVTGAGFPGSTSGTTTLLATAVAGTTTLTLPAATDTLVGKATTDTLTNKTLTSPVIATITNTGTLTLPAATDTLVGRATTDTLTNKTLTSPTLTTPNINSAQFATVSGTAPIYPCRAWVNFNGTGTVAIRASGNVSSITDNGTGDYTVNFTTALVDANYSVNVNARGSGDFTRGGGGLVYLPNTTPTTSAISFTTAVGASSANDGLALDMDFVYVAVFR